MEDEAHPLVAVSIHPSDAAVNTKNDEERYSKDDLFQAVYTGDVSKLESVLERLSPTEVDENGYNVLHFLAFTQRRNDIPQICKLLDKNNGFLKDRSQLIRQRDSIGNTPLHLACQYKVFGLVRYLIDLGADPLLPRKDGLVPLELMADGWTEQARISLQYMIDQSVSKGDLSEAIKTRLLFIAVNVKDKNKFATRVLEYLVTELQADTDVRNSERWTLLQVAARAGNSKAIEVIVNRKGVTPKVSAFTESTSSISTAVKRGANYLHLAVLSGQAGVVRLFLKNGASPRETNELRETPLHVLARQVYSAETVPVLNALMACVDLCVPYEREKFLLAEDSDGDTALEVACWFRQEQTVTLLLQLDQTDNRINPIWHTQRHLSAVMRECPMALIPFLDNSLRWKSVTSSSEIEVNFGLLRGKEGRERARRTDEEKLLPCESEVLFQILDPVVNRSVRHAVLGHPVIQLFVKKKWLDLTLISRGWIAFQLLLVLPLTTLLLDLYRPENDLTPSREQNVTNIPHNEIISNPIGRTILLGLVVFIAALTLVKELFQLWVRGPLSYIKSFINAVQITFVVTVLISVEPAFGPHGPTEEWQAYVAAVCGFLAWMLVLRDLANIPRCELYGRIFMKVCGTSIKMVLFYLPCLIAFLVAFRILLPSKDHFRFPLGFVKMTAMMVGELDYEYVRTSPEHPLSDGTNAMVQLFFMFFCVLISIVLLNLLIALAVNDIQQVIKDADESRIIGHLKFIHTAEMVLSRMNVLFNWNYLNNMYTLHHVAMNIDIEKEDLELQDSIRMTLAKVREN